MLHGSSGLGAQQDNLHQRPRLPSYASVDWSGNPTPTPPPTPLSHQPYVESATYARYAGAQDDSLHEVGGV